MTYHFAIDVVPEEDGDGYFVVVPTLPGCFSQGKTIEEAIENAQESIALHIQSLKERGEAIPSGEPTYHTVIEVGA